MDKKKSLREAYRGFSRAQRVQLLMASVLTLLLLIGIPTFAWFALSPRIETVTKIKAPATLDIKSGHAYSIRYLNLSDIDVTDVDSNADGHRDYVFAVKAGSCVAYDIQLAHTTNIPFTYKLYRASELGSSAQTETVPSGCVASFAYRDENEQSTVTYYYGYASNCAATEARVNSEDDAELLLADLNADAASAAAYGRTIAENEDGADGIYSDYSDYTELDRPEIYAVPLYSQHTDITTWNPDGDYFILRISWNVSNDSSAFAAWNAAANNKETDMIYLSAKASAGQ